MDPATQHGQVLATTSAGVGGCCVWLFLLPVSMEILRLHPSLQLALTLVNPTWHVELQKEPSSSCSSPESTTSLPWGDLAYSFGHQISLGVACGESGEKSGRLLKGGTMVELDMGQRVRDKGCP